ncbi:SAV_915 family protein [Streptomyces sp. NPDC056503]|uniref:SAV_915 family protein n=1 Tax=Streptomyces sp. NPDC056503 TaxID=3345842 RepID=UPI0036B7CED1
MPRTPHADDRAPAGPAPEPTDPEPVEPAPAGRLCVPVRPGGHGVTTRLYRTPVGARTAVAFTTPERLRATLGAEQAWIPLSEAALRALVRPLGVHVLTVDPVLTAPFTAAREPAPACGLPPAPAPAPTPAPAPAPTPASAQDPAYVRPGTPCARRFDPAARRAAA